eukprot:TRINITY_DN16348_c0_g1_i1.p2 TRINITY_DN16348_c0_g1~~TRINITY_DN16348_c0_g1_i1.p2  ORF type:complete len:470 (-),score=90.70 TRINITY_DN16348_c0_g1_i1:127-1404(-)
MPPKKGGSVLVAAGGDVFGGRSLTPRQPESAASGGTAGTGLTVGAGSASTSVPVRPPNTGGSAVTATVGVAAIGSGGCIGGGGGSTGVASIGRPSSVCGNAVVGVGGGVPGVNGGCGGGGQGAPLRQVAAGTLAGQLAGRPPITGGAAALAATAGTTVAGSNGTAASGGCSGGSGTSVTSVSPAPRPLKQAAGTLLLGRPAPKVSSEAAPVPSPRPGTSSVQGPGPGPGPGPGAGLAPLSSRQVSSEAAPVPSPRPQTQLNGGPGTSSVQGPGPGPGPGLAPVAGLAPLSSRQAHRGEQQASATPSSPSNLSKLGERALGGERAAQAAPKATSTQSPPSTTVAGRISVGGGAGGAPESHDRFDVSALRMATTAEQITAALEALEKASPRTIDKDELVQVRLEKKNAPATKDLWDDDRFTKVMQQL